MTPGRLVLGTERMLEQPYDFDWGSQYLQTGGAQHFSSVHLHDGYRQIQLTAGIDGFLDLGIITRGRSAFLNVTPITVPTPTLAIRASNTNINGILGAWATAGNDWAANDGQGNIVPFANYITLDAANRRIDTDPAQNIKVSSDVTPVVTLADAQTTALNTLILQGTEAGTLRVESGQTLKLSAGGGIWAQPGSNTPPPSRWEIGTGDGTDGTLTAASTPGTVSDIFLRGALDIHTTITDDPATGGAVALIFSGGSAFLGGANTYSGGTVVSGALSVLQSDGLGTGTMEVNGNITFDPAARPRNNFIMAPLTQRNIGENGLPGTRLQGGASLGTLDSFIALDIAGGIRGQNTDILAKITGAGSLGFKGIGTLLNPGNDYTGDTNLYAGGTDAYDTPNPTILKIRADNVIPHGAGHGDVWLIEGRYEREGVTLDMNGHDVTINGLNSSYTPYSIRLGKPLQVTNNAPSGVATLTVGDGNAHGTYYDIITDGLTAQISLNKIGTGKQFFEGSLTHTGGTTVSAGLMALSGQGTLAGEVFVKPGATFRHEATAPLAANVNLEGAGVSQAARFEAEGTVTGLIHMDDIGDTLVPGADKLTILTLTQSQQWSGMTMDLDLKTFDGRVAGVDHDQIIVQGRLDFAANRGGYLLNVRTLDGFLPGTLSGSGQSTNEVAQTIEIMTVTGGISGFDGSQWTINAEDLAQYGYVEGRDYLGVWADHRAVHLSYYSSPIPEPSGALLILAAFTIMVTVRRRPHLAAWRTSLGA